MPALSRLAKNFGAIGFVLALLLLAMAVLATWAFVEPARALPIAISVLVVSCPCALSLATPAAQASALGLLTRQGVLIGNGNALEAIAGSVAKLGTAEVRVNLLHGAVGSITEGDVALAKASRGLIIGFNVRANPQAREMARRDGVEIRYYSVIYDIIDDIKAAMSGLLSPTLRERFLGNAEIREVFNISKVGKIAGCRVTEGMVKRGAKVRLLRDNVVIHEGTLKTLRRFKDEVREVREGFECGIGLGSFNDIKVGDIIETFEMREKVRA